MEHCRYYLRPEGCKKGDQCPYPHLDNPPVKVCKYYRQGTCRKGTNCPFSHDDSPPMPLQRAEDTTIPLLPTEDEAFERQFKNMTVRYAADLLILKLTPSTDPIEGLVQPNHTGSIEGQVQPNSEQEEQAADMCTVLFSWYSNDTVHEERQVDCLRGMLANAGIVDQYFKVKRGGQNDQRIKVFMTFASPDIALRALEYDNYDLQSTLLRSHLRVEHIVKTRVFVPSTIYNKFSTSITGLASPGVTVRSSQRGTRRTAVIMITGPVLENVMKVRADINMIVSGRVVMTEEGKPLWDDLFMTRDGKLAIAQLCEDNKTYIHCDEKSRKVTTYCVDHDHKALHERISTFGLFTMVEFRQPLEDDLLRRLTTARVAFIQTIFDIAVNLDHTVQPPIMSYQCTMTQARTIQAWLLRLRSSGIADTVEQCPICLEGKAEGVTLELKCGHMYHADCFDGLVNNGIQDAKPIQCCGSVLDDDLCDHVVTISELSKALLPGLVQQRLEQATTVYLASQSTRYGYCSTPDCGAVFSVTSEPTLFQCPLCDNTMCTACKYSSHDGQTCEEFLRQQTEDLSEEAQKELGICVCPRCNTRYMKDGGCNHMECRVLTCLAHFCFPCGAVFETETECHNHLVAEHGGIFGNDYGGEDMEGVEGNRPEPVENQFAAEQAWMGEVEFGQWAGEAQADRLRLENDGLEIVWHRRFDGRAPRRRQPFRFAAAGGVAARRMGRLIQAQQRIHPEDRNPNRW